MKYYLVTGRKQAIWSWCDSAGVLMYHTRLSHSQTGWVVEISADDEARFLSCFSQAVTAVIRPYYH